MSVPHDTRVRAIFDRIAWRYDLLNGIISFRLDSLWRRRAINALGIVGKSALVLDMGTGTGSLALEACKVVAPDAQIVGLDFSPTMLERARAQTNKKGHDGRAAYVLAHARTTPMRNDSFDAVMSAFVLRNVGDLQAFFRESYRVLQPGGRMVSLDMYPPPQGLFAGLYWLYFGKLMPLIGSALSRDPTAYRYLSESVRAFVPPNAVATTIASTGFVETQTIPYLRGAICLHLAAKPL